MLTYNCSCCKTVINKYYNFHVRTFDAQLAGAASIVQQHLTKTPYSAAIDTTLRMSSCILQEYSNHIVWTDSHHKWQEMQLRNAVTETLYPCTLFACWWSHSRRIWTHKGNNTIG